MKHAYLLAFGLLVACAPKAHPVAAHTEVARPTPAPLAAPKAPEPFPTWHVVARGFPGNDERPSRMELCPIEHAVFVCGGDRMIRLKENDLVAEDELLQGLPRDEHGHLAGRVDDVTGSWPNDIWVRLALHHHDPGFAYYRYQGGANGQGGFQHVFTPPAGPHSLSYRVTLVRGGDHPAFAVSDVERPTKVFTPKGGGAPPEGHPIVAKRLNVIFAGMTPYGPDLRIESLKKPVSWPIPLPKVGTFWFTSVDDELLGYGGDEHGPFLAQFDGKQWAPMDTAGVREPIREYLHLGNYDWAVTEHALHRRSTGGTFTRWELPEGTRRVWIRGDADVWLARSGDGYEGQLLRTIAPTNEARFE